MRTSIRAALAVASAAAVMVGTASTAMADSATVKDKRYDVLVAQSPGSVLKLASGGTYQQAIKASQIDAKELKVNHGKDFVSVRVNMNRLGENSVISGAIKLNGGVDEDAYFYAGFDGDEVYAQAYLDNDSGYCTSNGQGSGGIKTAGDDGANGFVQLYIPRSCLGSPNTLKAAAASLNGFFIDLSSEEAKAQAKAAFSNPAELVNRAGAAKVDPDANFFVDPINSKYTGNGSRNAEGAVQYTPWLSRN
jgi:hypothetical protein